MPKHYNLSPRCKLCAFGSKFLGHPLAKLFGQKWNKITIEQVGPAMTGLSLKIVGGLSYRSYTENDIDVVGDENDVPVLVRRLKEKNIHNLVHYCGPGSYRHYHWIALKNGLLVIFLGNQMYLKNPKQ